MEQPQRHRDTELIQVNTITEKIIGCAIKTVEKMNPVFETQVLTYLRAADIRVGLLINFNTPLLRQGIKRLIV